MLRPKRLPRGCSSIITGVVYSPPESNNNDVLVYLRTSMEYIEANYTNYSIILLRDFLDNFLGVLFSLASIFQVLTVF